MDARTILKDLATAEQDSAQVAQARKTKLGELAARLQAGESTGDLFVDMSILSGLGYGDGEDDGPALLRAFDAKLRAHAGEFVLSLVTEESRSGGCGVFGRAERDFPAPRTVVSARFGILNGLALVPHPTDRKVYGIGVDRHVRHPYAKGAIGAVEITEGPLFPDALYGNVLPFVCITLQAPRRFNLGILRNDLKLFVGNEEVSRWVQDYDGLADPRAERFFWAGKALGKPPLHDSFVRWYVERKREDVQTAIGKAESERTAAQDALGAAHAKLAALEPQLAELRGRLSDLGTEDVSE